MTVNLSYTTDASGFQGWAEDIAIPVDEQGVLAALEKARAGSMPVTIAGAGSGLTGARVAQGGLVLSLERFQQLEIGKGRARAGAAVLLTGLEQAATQTGQFFAPAPPK